MSPLPFDATPGGAPVADLAPSDIPTVRLGAVDLPRLGLGCAPLGELFERVGRGQADDMLAAALDAGIRYFDTAPWYGRGKSEHHVGRALWDYPRDQVILSTKVGRVFHRRADPTKPVADQWMGGLPFEHRFDYTYDGIMRSFEDSLMRLGMDSVDMLVIHDLDAWHHGDDAGVQRHLDDLSRSGWKALDALRSGGSVKAVGAGINLCGLTGEFLDRMPLDFFLVAMRLTLLEHAEFVEKEMPRLQRDGVGAVIGGVFSSGLAVTGPVEGAYFNYAPAGPEIMDHARKIVAIAQRHGVALPAAALQFPLRIPGVAAVIPGAVSADQVRGIDRWFRAEIPDAFWSDLRSEGLIRPG